MTPTINNDLAELIYRIYPRHVAKPAALKAIHKALKKYTSAYLIDKTTEYDSAVKGMERQFIPHPATWFNQERFNDDPKEWNPKESGRRSVLPP